MEQKKTILSPLTSTGNEYINIIRSILNENDYETVDKMHAFKEYKTISIANLNWYEKIGSNNPAKAFTITISRILYLYYLKYICKIKIIYTLHNKTTHDKKKRKYASIIMTRLCTCADAIVILSEDSRNYLQQMFPKAGRQLIENKICYIPHPNYIGIYPECQENPFPIPQDGQMNLLYMGYIQPYKNIEMIINLAEKVKNLDIRFIIAGGCSSASEQTYFNNICSDIRNISNILLYPKVVPDEALSYFIRSSHAMILPYRTESSLNSGMCILAFSYERNVICPQIGTIMDYPLEYTYSYRYETDSEHSEKLYRATIKAYDEFRNHRDLFLKKQQHIHHLVCTKNSRKNISEKYQKLYDRLYNEWNKIDEKK